MWAGTYILRGREAIPAPTLEWADWFERAVKSGERILCQEVVGERFVSTVFLGVDHNWGQGPPVLFETMVFHLDRDAPGKPDSGDEYADDDGAYTNRYSTWDAAMAGHHEIVGRLRRRLAHRNTAPPAGAPRDDSAQ